MHLNAELRGFPSKFAGGTAWLLLCCLQENVRCEKLIETKTVKQKEPELDDLGNSQPIQTVEDTNVRRLAVRKARFGEKTEGMAEETTPVAHGCAQPRTGKGLPSHGGNLQDEHEGDRRFLRMLYQLN